MADEKELTFKNPSLSMADMFKVMNTQALPINSDLFSAGTGYCTQDIRTHHIGFGGENPNTTYGGVLQVFQQSRA